MVSLVQIASMNAGQTRAPIVAAVWGTGHAAAVQEPRGQHANPAPEDTTGETATFGAALRKHAMVEEGAHRLGRASVRMGGRAHLARFAQRPRRGSGMLNLSPCRGRMGGSARQGACGAKDAKAWDDAAGTARASARQTGQATHARSAR